MKAIVTGGSRGIGAEIVRKLCERNDNVVFIYRTQDQAAQQLCAQTGALCIKADLSDPQEAENAVIKASELLGGIDILINNAGISHIGLFTDMSHAQIKQMLDSDLNSTIYCTQAAAKEMIRAHRGYIVNISSMWGVTGASCETVYSAAKAGVIGFTRALAKELGPSGITVNCVAPGVIKTDMNASLDPNTLKELCDDTPLCRIGDVTDVANAVLFLASDKASFITGETLNVNGGMVI